MASSATLGADSGFAGNIVALTSITMLSRVTLSGRALARNGNVTLMNDLIAYPACFVPAPTAPAAAPAVLAAVTTTAGPTTGMTLRPTDVLTTTVDSGPGPTPVILVGIAFALGIVGAAAGRRWLLAMRSR